MEGAKKNLRIRAGWCNFRVQQYTLTSPINTSGTLTVSAAAKTVLPGNRNSVSQSVSKDLS